MEGGCEGGGGSEGVREEEGARGSEGVREEEGVRV